MHLVLEPRFEGGDAPAEKTHDGFGDDISKRVSNLNHNLGLGSGDAEDGGEVHDRVERPGKNGDEASLGNQFTRAFGLFADGISKSDVECVNDHEKGDHGHEPEHLAGASVVSDLTGVSQENHDGRESSKLLALGGSLFGVKSHDKDELHEEKGHGEEPIDVTVSVVEGESGVSDDTVLQGVGVIPGVKDADIVVEGDKSHEA